MDCAEKMQAVQEGRKAGDHAVAERLTQGDRILRLREVISTTGLARSTIYLRMSKGHFPKPVRLGPRAVGWRASDVGAWLDERQAV